MFSTRQRIAATSFSDRSEYTHQLHFDPHLADIGPTLFTRKEPVVEELRGAFKISRFRQIENQFEDQRRRRSVYMRIFFQRFHAFARRPVQQAQSLVYA